MARGLLSLSTFAFCTTAFAGHLPGGNITYECVGANEYMVTLTLFRDCGGAPLLSQSLTFASDCGSSYTLNALPPGAGTEVSQLCPAELPNSTCNGGTLPGIEVYTVQASAFMGACDGWTISWTECCRIGSLNVMGNPGTYVEARLNSVTAPCNNSPVFTQDVIPYVCVNQPVSYNLGVTEPDGDQLRYTLIAARDYSGGPVNVTYEPGYSGTEPFTGMTIDSLTGQIGFTPTLLGNIITAVRVDEYDSTGALVGSVMRDFLFVVTACLNNAPDPASGTVANLTGGVATGINSIEMCLNSTICFDVSINDADATQTLALTSNINVVLPEAIMTVGGTNPATAGICFTPVTTGVGTYGFVITAEDDGCPNTALTTYAYTIVISASPNAGTDGFATICSTDTLADPFPFLGGDPDTTGTWSSGGPGIYIYVVPGIAPCPNDTSTVVVNEVQAPDAGLQNAIGVCENGPLVLMFDSLLGTPEPGGSWTDPLANIHSGNFDPATDLPGVYCYTVTGTPPCADDQACLVISLIPATDPACLTIGIAAIEMSTVLISPEPNNGLLQLTGLSGANAEIAIFDQAGRLCWSEGVRAVEGSVLLRLPGELGNGRYVVRVRGADGVDHRLPFTLVR